MQEARLPIAHVHRRDRSLGLTLNTVCALLAGRKEVPMSASELGSARSSEVWRRVRFELKYPANIVQKIPAASSLLWYIYRVYVGYN